jgi:DNA-directed RNA polymerase specialized sigma subunit
LQTRPGSQLTNDSPIRSSVRTRLTAPETLCQRLQEAFDLHPEESRIENAVSRLSDERKLMLLTRYRAHPPRGYKQVAEIMKLSRWFVQREINRAIGRIEGDI